jgi:hypothetical protein
MFFRVLEGCNRRLVSDNQQDGKSEGKYYGNSDWRKAR